MPSTTRTADQADPHGDGRGAAPVQIRALVARRYGPPSVLEVATVDRPEPGPGQVLVRVAAAGVSRAALHLLTGRPLLLRLAGFGVRRPRQPVVGIEVAGVVAALGEGVTGFDVGDEVFGYASGACGELAVAEASKLAPKPAALTFVEASCLVDSASTALQAVRDHGQVRAGQRVLVLGASGGVGSLALQVAVAAGAEVTGTSSPAKAALVRSLGAADVIDHTAADPLAVDQPYDVIIDVGGRRPIRRLRRALSPDGVLVLVGGEGGGAITGGFQRQILAPVQALGSSQRVVSVLAKEQRATLEAIAELAEAGRLRPVIDRVHRLDDGAAAFERMAAGQILGKDAVEIG